MPPTHTTAPNMCRARATAVMSELRIPRDEGYMLAHLTCQAPHRPPPLRRHPRDSHIRHGADSLSGPDRKLLCAAGYSRSSRSFRRFTCSVFSPTELLGATDNTSPCSPRSGGLRPPSSGSRRPDHRTAATSRRSLLAPATRCANDHRDPTAWLGI